MKNVLFLCTGNSCRSIMAEGLLAHYGEGNFLASSAGSFPVGYVHPLSLETLRTRGIKADNYRSKSWDEFVGQKIDFVITVCDNARGESCPIFLGKSFKAHWGVPDPAKFEGNEQEIKDEFSRVCDILERRVQMFINLPFDDMDVEDIQKKLSIIGTI